jgi:hypothetical protein
MGRGAPPRKVEISRIGRRLRNIDQQLEALDLAISEFSPNRLEDPTWVDAFTSGDPRDINRIMQVMGGYEHVVQNLVEVAKSAGRVTGRADRRRPPANEAIALMDSVGALPKRARERLDDHYVFRGRLSHTSPDVGPEEVADYAERALTEIPAMVGAIRRWLESEGVSF